MAARTIRCTVVEVPHMSDEMRHARRERSREVLPWADPYIASLVEKLRAAESNSPFALPRWDRWRMAGEHSPVNEQPPPFYDPHPEIELPRRKPGP